MSRDYEYQSSFMIQIYGSLTNDKQKGYYSGSFYMKGVTEISEIIIKINSMSYNLLKKFAKGGEFRKESKNKDGQYYISIDKKVFDELKKIDDDLNKAIIFTCFQNKING